jgi:hypothetical protein
MNRYRRREREGAASALLVARWVARTIRDVVTLERHAGYGVVVNDRGTPVWTDSLGDALPRVYDWPWLVCGPVRRPRIELAPREAEGWTDAMIDREAAREALAASVLMED